ncbi:chloride channel protein [Actinomyces radicidentis]|uniref:chloride channel protein n=1 Tax=Actinomyces radicidentis TaxID=111015 RepID=UPI000A045C53
MTGGDSGRSSRSAAPARPWHAPALRARAHDDVLALLRHHRTGLFSLAVVVGVLSGLASVVFRLGIDAWTRVLTGAEDYTIDYGPSTGVLAFAGRWFVLLAPVLSGLLVGPLMTRLGRTPTGHGVGGVIWSARRSDGAMAPVPATASMIASALTIGGGGSVGPEGPIAEVGASAATVFGRRLGLPTRSVRMLAAAGTAAGIAAAFNAPLAGAFFAMEVVLLDFSMDAFTFVVLASVSSTVLSHHLLGTTLSVQLPSLNLAGDAALGWVAALGLLGGIVGVAFSRLRFLATDAAQAVRGLLHLPSWALPGVGGLVVGAMLLVVPETYGESDAVLNRALDGRYTVLALLVLTVAKIVATSVTLGLGFTGGVFAPSLFIGGTLGALFGELAVPEHPDAAAVFGVIGMCAVFSGSARAPITGVILIIEMTGQYSLLMPLMLATVLATFASRFLTRTTIYTEELRRRGEDVDDPVRSTIVGRTTARALMGEPPAVLTADMTLRRAASVLRASGSAVLPVVAVEDPAPRAADGTPSLGRLLGCVSAVAVAEAGLAEDGPTTVGGLPLTHEHVGVGDGATTVLGALVDSRADGLPVVAPPLDLWDEASRSDGDAAVASAPGLDESPSGGPQAPPDVLVGWVGQEEMVRRLYRHQRRALEAAQARTSFGARAQARWRRRRATAPQRPAGPRPRTSRRRPRR